MSPEARARLSVALLLGLPALAWFAAARWASGPLGHPRLRAIWRLLEATPEHPLWWGAAAGAFGVAVVLVALLGRVPAGPFRGAPFTRRLRGSGIVRAGRLARESGPSAGGIDVAGVPLPAACEALHLLVVGATGTGKTVLLRRLAWSALQRRDRCVFVDPNGEMLARFYRDGDTVLNPFDARGQGWSFFNEIRADFDFERYALSLVPRGRTAEAEEWAGYARLLLRECARKLALIGRPEVQELFRWTTIAEPAELKKFLAGTVAESLFVGADKALASARFVLSDKLPPHLAMPAGNFSLRDWLEAPHGNLFLTWREDMAPALRPLLSAWVDVLCASTLSMPEDPARRLWLILDELASLEKLASLEAALTKGRKHGLRVAAGLQSTAQLDDLYGPREAQTLRACFRNLVVLGGAKTDPATCEDMSRSLGEHEVERPRRTRTSGKDRMGSSTTTERVRERIILASEIAALPDREGLVAFAGDWPVARVTVEPLRFRLRHPGLVERPPC